jgi:hypothetical protein
MILLGVTENGINTGAKRYRCRAIPVQSDTGNMGGFQHKAIILCPGRGPGRQVFVLASALL